MTYRMGYSNPRPLHRASLVQGSETLVLSHDEIFLGLDYVPGAAPLFTERTVGRTLDGDRVTHSRRGNVAEVLPLLIGSNNGPYSNDGIIQQIEAMLLKQERYNQTRQGDQLYLTYYPTAGRRHRTPVYAGSLDHIRGTMRGRGIARHQSTLTIERAPWWESMTEVELPVSNRHGTDVVTTGLRIDNHADGSAVDNFVDIDGSVIKGNVAAPLRLSLANNTGGALSWRNIFAGKFAHPGPGMDVDEYVHYLQGEDMTAPSGGDPAVVAAGNSGGEYQPLDVTTTLTRLGYWSLTAAQCETLSGGLVQMMVRFHDEPPNPSSVSANVVRLQFWLETSLAANVPLMKTPDIALSGRRLEAMGTLAIPPGLPGLVDDTAIILSLWGYAETATAINLDFVHMMPTESFRYYRQTQGDLNADGTLFDNGERVWISSAAGVTFQRTVPTGAPLTLDPGMDTRLYFLFDEAANAMVISRQLLVRVFYRPRILTLGQA